MASVADGPDFALLGAVVTIPLSLTFLKPSPRSESAASVSTSV